MAETLQETTAAADERPRLYKLDWETAEVAFSVLIYDLIHRFRRPTRKELTERENRQNHEVVRHGKTEYEEQDTEAAAAGELWDKIATDVCGYGNPAGSWATVDADIRGRVPLNHKAEAIAGLYMVKMSVDKSVLAFGGFDLNGNTEYTVKAEMGDYCVRYVLRQPDEASWADFERKSATTRTVTGGENVRTVTKTNLGAACAFFDTLFLRVDGATVGGEPWAESRRAIFLEAIDPVHKQMAAFTLYKGLSAHVRD